MPKSTLSELGIVELEADIRTLSRAELAPHFASRRSGRIVLTRLLRSVVWQARERIASGIEPPVRGNLRTFWYRFVKPVLAHIPDDDQARKDPYDVMLRVFAELVLDAHLVSYRDFDFTDENWENRRIGKDLPDTILFAEKTGWVRWLREAHERFSVTTLALGGAPSALTSEYTLWALREQADLDPERHSLRLIGLVDYDPSGWIIAHSFQNQLAKLGWPDSTLETLIDPADYSAEELEMFVFELPKKQQTKTAKWLEKTGGIGGKPLGLEAESQPYDRLLERVEVRLAPRP